MAIDKKCCICGHDCNVYVKLTYAWVRLCARCYQRALKRVR